MDNLFKSRFDGQTNSYNQDVLDSIAVVGFSMKFPEEATSAEGFWDMIIKGRCVSAEFPKDRLNIEAFYDSDQDVQGAVILPQTENSGCSYSLRVHNPIDRTAWWPLYPGRLPCV